MHSGHIVRSYDEELNELDNLIARMGGLIESQMTRAIEGMVKRDASLASEVVHDDRQVDSLEHEVNLQTTRLLALRQPVANDLRSIMVALKTSSDLERIGDLAKNIAKRTSALAEAPPMAAVHTIERMGNLVQAMIHTVLNAYMDGNGDKAEDVRNQDEIVDQLHTSLFRELLTYMMEDPRNITSCTHLLFIAKNVERAGDHATNIAENVLFSISGAYPEESRPKGDRSSTTVVK